MQAGKVGRGKARAKQVANPANKLSTMHLECCVKNRNVLSCHCER